MLKKTELSAHYGSEKNIKHIEIIYYFNFVLSIIIAKRRLHIYICSSNIVPWCNWLTRLTLDQKSLGSSPSGTAKNYTGAFV